MATALLFPGQGSQRPTMRQVVEAERPDLLDAVRDALGADPFERLEEGTAYLQPAIFCASLANLRRAGGLEADLYAGHSLGELTALVAAGSLSEADGLRLVVARGRLMQRAAEEGAAGAMLAVGASREAVTELAASLGVVVANDNSPEQVVLSGGAEAIERAREIAAERGLRSYRLPIRGAFHSPALAGVAAEFRAELDAVEVRPPRGPVLSCVTVEEFDDVRARLAESLTSGVRWREVMLALHARGARRYVDAGPGEVLRKLARRILGRVEASALEALETAHA